MDSKHFRAVMGKFATGVTVVGFFRDGAPAGLTANAFMSVSLDPALILLSLRKSSSFLHSVKIGERFGVSVLSREQRELSDHFGGRRRDDFASPFTISEGAPLLEGALAAVVARVVEYHVAGDHSLVIGAVESMRETHGQPLLFFGGRYSSLDEHVHPPKPKLSAASELAWWTD